MPLPPGLTESDFSDLLEEFRRAVGSEYVYSSDEHLQGYRDGVSPLYQTDQEPVPSAAVAPENVEEVQEVVQIANRYQIPFWVNSTGKNFGYGGPAGVVNGTVNLDLKRMNRILEVNEANAYALVEPGVSFFELYRYLRERDIKLWLDVPSPGWGSIIGNTIEYGLGYTDQGQRVNFLCGMEVVLPNGEVMRTGQGAIPGGQTWQHYRRSIGPRIDELFCQTNYGVVTQMGIWLRPEPPAYLAASIMTDRNEKIIPMIDTMRPLRLGGIINNNATLYRYPFVQEGEENPDNPGGWNNRVAFYGLEGVVKQHWEHVQDAYNDAMPGTTFASDLYTTPYDLDSLGRSPDRLMAGIPSLGASLHKTYFSMALPFDGQAAWDLILLLDEASKRHGRRYFGMAHHVETPHEMVTTSSALLRPGDDDYNQTTMRMIRDWIASTGEQGLGPYRVSTPYMDDAMAQFSFNNHRLRRFYEELKDVIDPNGIMAPGKNGIWPRHMRGDRA